MLLWRGRGRFDVMGIYGAEQSLRSPTLRGFSVPLQEIF